MSFEEDVPLEEDLALVEDLFLAEACVGMEHPRSVEKTTAYVVGWSILHQSKGIWK